MTHYHTTESTEPFIGFETDSFLRNETVRLSLYLLLLVFLLFASLSLQHLATLYIPEATIVVFLGLVCSFIIMLCNGYDENSHSSWYTSSLGLSESAFFFGFLPPILFNGGYHLKRSYFYGNIIPILLLVILGTLISITVITVGLWIVINSNVLTTISKGDITLFECITFSSLISSTDPVSVLAIFQRLKVDMQLFYIVFGESSLNDAMALVLFKVSNKAISIDKVFTSHDIIITIIKFIIISVGSSFIGYLFGIVAAYYYKKVNFHGNALAQIGILVCLIYMPFLLCEMLQLSGIVSILFAGISCRRYCKKNLSNNAKKNASFLFKMLSHLCETACFGLLGLSVFSLPNKYYWDFILTAFFLCLLGRALAVYPLLHLANYLNSSIVSTINAKDNVSENGSTSLPSKENGAITIETMHVVMFSGMRGCVAFACASVFNDKNGNKDVFLCTTIAVAIITLLLQGCLTYPLVKLLGIKTNISVIDAIRYIKDTQGISGGISFEERVIYPLVLKDKWLKMHSAGDKKNYHHASSVVMNNNGIRHMHLHKALKQRSPTSGGGSYTCSNAEESAISHCIDDDEHNLLGRFDSDPDTDIGNSCDDEINDNDGDSNDNCSTASATDNDNCHDVEDGSNNAILTNENLMKHTLGLDKAATGFWNYGRA